MIDFGHPKGVQSTVFVPLSLLTALFVIPLVARDLLQHFNLYWIHRYLGIAGTLLFIMSLIRRP